jgi:hypothetical protein
MLLKAAYFALTGLADTDVITPALNMLPAIQRGRTVFGIAWPHSGQGHNVRAWAELLVAERAATPGAAYPTPLGLEVQTCGQRIGQLWSEALRYHKNRAYLFEVRQVREAAEWLLTNAGAL